MQAPKRGPRIRPLTEQARAALFNILAARTVDGRFLDLFAGTGAVGIEALSRGAARAVFVELDRAAVLAIRQNLASTGFTDRAEIYALDVIRALKILSGQEAQFDVIFMGAPYDSPALEQALIMLSETALLKPDGVLIAEHRKQHRLQAEYKKLKMVRDSRYGETVLSFYENGSLSGQF